MTPKPKSARPDLATTRQDAGPSAATGPFVLNLCSANSPVSLATPQIPALSRFTFFVSRRLEDGRERFRLHMGYFSTLAEAEEWLPIVRDVFPSAWVGDAPGKRLQQVARSAGQPNPPSSGAQAAPGGSSSSSPTQPARTAPSATAGAPGSNIREVLAQLDAGPAPAEANAGFPAAADASSTSLSDSQVLRVLEGRGPGGSVPPLSRDVASVPLLKPDDTGTRHALREAVEANSPVSFSVQLHWSVQTIDLTRVPPLAIFSAYTLYTVEGSREGRKWYGLRLGFFSDAVAAKQVAHYVRSEFASVAIVPVSQKERERALGGQPRPVGKPAPLVPKKADLELSERFQLIDEPPRQMPTADFDDAPDKRKGTVATSKAAVPPTPPVAAAGNARPAGNRVRANSRRPPETLEETLEILGASALQMQSEEPDSKTGVRHVRIETQQQKSSPFTRLMDRLADRLNKG